MFTRILLVSAILLAHSPSHAQTTSLAPSPMLACLTTLPGAPTTPAYPEEAFKRKDGALVSIELEFEGPDRAPKVQVAHNNYARDFDDAVRAHVKNLRLPCMAAGAAPVTLKQNYVFRPTDGRKVMPPQTEDPADIARRAKMACLTHLKPGSRPDYPFKALREARDGKLLARLTFSDRSTAPAVKYLAEMGGRDFRSALDLHIEGLRLPCLDQGEVSIDIMYNFYINGNGKTVLQDMSLRELVGGSLDPAPIQADLTQMACPFDVRMQYMQPHAPNRVYEVETTNASRRPVLDWLTTLRLRLPKKTNDAVFGDSFTVSVPCGNIDL